MPYTVVTRDNEYCVVKKTDPGGKSFGCHPSRPKAIAQMQAIVINEHKSLTEDELKDMSSEIGAQLDLLDDGEECDCKKDLTLPEGDFILLEDLNTLAPGWQDGVEVKEGGIPGPENRMGNIPAQMLKGLCKKIGKDPGFYSRCITHNFGGKVTDVKAFCADLHKSCVGKFPGEHRRKKKEAEEMDWKAWAREQFDSLSGKLDGLVHQVKEQLHAKQPAAESEPGEEKKAKCPKCGKSVEAEDGKCPECGAKMEEKSLDGSMFYKDVSTGALRWLAVYTNKFRDRDHPPEIISDAAHRDFVKAVNGGEWPMPEYRLWHIAAPIGRADFLAYHDGGWVVASGTVNKGMERVVELMDAAPFRWTNSHGMPVVEIRRDDPADKTILTRYRDKEITALPEWAAANELTFNLITGGGEMGFSDKDRERLTQMFGDKAAEVEKLLTEFSQKADGVIESKETNPEAPPDPATLPPSRQEVADAVTPLAEAVQAMAKQLDAITKALADIKGDAEQKEKEAVARTPAASLAELIQASIVKSRPGETKIKGKDKDMTGPKETPIEDKAAVGSLGGAAAIPFLRDLMMPKSNED